MWRLINFLLMVIFLFNCNKERKKESLVSAYLPQVDSEILSSERMLRRFDFRLKDTIFSDGSYVKIDIADSISYLVWGNDNFNKKIKSENFEWALMDRLYFDWKNKDFVALRYGCGSPCWGAIILPLKKEKKILEFMHQFDYDIENNLVVYQDEDKNERRFLSAENLLNGKKQIIDELSECRIGHLGFCIDSISLKNKMLYLEWNPDSDPQKTTKHRIKINL